MRLLFSPDGVEGAGTPAADGTPEPAAQPGTSQEAGAATPPAAETVINNGRSERETELESELQRERESHASTAAEKRAREQRINELEDELRRLKQAQSEPPARPKQKRGGFALTLLEDDDDED